MLGHEMVLVVERTTSTSFGRGGEAEEEESARSRIILAAMVFIFITGFVNILIGCEWVRLKLKEAEEQ